MFVWVIAFLQRILAAAKLHAAADVNGTLDEAKVILYQSPVNPAPNLLLADLLECTFTGYARSTAVAWGTATLSTQTGLPYLPGDLKTFSCTGGDEQNIAGYAIISGDVTPVLLGLRQFASTLKITSGYSLSLIPRAGIDSDGPIPDADPQLN